jgi:hypothetical protein
VKVDDICGFFLLFLKSLICSQAVKAIEVFFNTGVYFLTFYFKVSIDFVKLIRKETNYRIFNHKFIIAQLFLTLEIPFIFILELDQFL